MSKGLEISPGVNNPQLDIEIIDPLGETRHFVKKIRKGKQNIIPVEIPTFSTFNTTC